MAEDQLVLPIIDSHIHLFPESEVDSLAWCSPSNPLHGQRSVAEYKEATKSTPSLLGFVFVETDRKNDLQDEDGSGWDAPLQEVNWLKRIALGQPRDGEGHTADDAKLCLGIVPWAPLPSGKDAMERYIDRVREEAGDAWPKVKGFRYLLQDKPHGTMLTADFIESLRLLGRRGLVFEVGVDQHRRGKKQLDEVVEMIERAHDGVEEDKKVTFVLSMFSLSLCPPVDCLSVCLFSGFADARGIGRPPVQARSHHIQHHIGPGLPQLAHGHVHAQQGVTHVYEVVWRLLRDARVAALAGAGAHFPIDAGMAGHRAGDLRPLAHHVWQRLAGVYPGRHGRRGMAQVEGGRGEDVLDGHAVG
jgi:hypothetical protein